MEIFPGSMPMVLQMASASGGLELPANIFTSGIGVVGVSVVAADRPCTRLRKSNNWQTAIKRIRALVEKFTPRAPAPLGQGLKLVEEAEVVFVEQADVADAVADHRDALDSEAERPAAPFFRVVPDVLKHRRVHHAAA